MGRMWREYFDSEYLKGDALPDGGRTWTIAAKSRDNVEDSHRLALTFTDGTKWLTNVTNCKFMEAMFGTKDVAEWVGRRVTLAFDPTIKFGTETVGGIRVIGSPELTVPVSFMFQENSRKKPRRVTLHPTQTQEAAPATETAISGDLATSEHDGSHTAPESLSGQIFTDDAVVGGE